MAAIESDRGAFSPIGFTIDASDSVENKIRSWKPLFEPYNMHIFISGGSGADIGKLKGQATALIGFLPDRQRYFNYHHSDNDTFDKVVKRELEMGAAAMAALVYLIDQEGLE